MSQVTAEVFGSDGAIILLVDMAIVTGVIAVVVYLIRRPRT
jgi:hypothetical protein